MEQVSQRLSQLGVGLEGKGEQNIQAFLARPLQEKDGRFGFWRKLQNMHSVQTPQTWTNWFLLVLMHTLIFFVCWMRFL